MGLCNASPPSANTVCPVTQDISSTATIASAMSSASPSRPSASESLIFAAEVGGRTDEYVIRIPPSGGGIFPNYDLGAQTLDLLHEHGIPTPSPILYEPSREWIGSKFLLMPRIVGHTPSDTTYATRGWLHDAGPDVQRRVHDSFLETLAQLQRVPVGEATWLERPAGVGVAAELRWWREYAKWGTDNKVPDIMTEAFDWLARRMPDETGELSVCWNDARLSNAIFDDAGQIVGALDWEQACLCPAETDFAWWLATRRQMLEVSGLDLDPELPGFDSREQVIRRYEEMIGRPLVDLPWYEVFAMVRDGLLHPAHAGTPAQHRPGRSLPHAGTDSAWMDRLRRPGLTALRTSRGA